jgi:hypothetical protein
MRCGPDAPDHRRPFRRLRRLDRPCTLRIGATSQLQALRPSWPCSSPAGSTSRCAILLPGRCKVLASYLPGLVPAAVAALLARIFLLRAMRRQSPMSQVSPGRSSALTFCTLVRSKRAPSVWRALAELEPSIVSSFQALSPPIWHDLGQENGLNSVILPAGLAQAFH